MASIIREFAPLIRNVDPHFSNLVDLKALALARVVAQQEVETIAGWLHPSTAASSQRLQNCGMPLRMQQGRINL
jgi:hypothetical protein